MPIRDVFTHIDPDFLDRQGGENRWETVGQSLLDNLALGRLKAFGRRRRSTGTLTEIKGLDFWANARWTYLFFQGVINSPHDVKHSRTEEAYADVQFDRAQILSAWPKPRARIVWPDYPRWRKADPIRLSQAACLWWDIEPETPMPPLADSTFHDMKAFFAHERMKSVMGDPDTVVARALALDAEYRRILDEITPETLVSRADLVAFTKTRAHTAKFLEPELSLG